MKESLQNLINETVVVDTATEWLYIGCLQRLDADALVLTEVDAHYGPDSNSSKEIYIYECRKNGLHANRSEVYVNLRQVVSVSPLEAVKVF